MDDHAPHYVTVAYSEGSARCVETERGDILRFSTRTDELVGITTPFFEHRTVRARPSPSPKPCTFPPPQFSVSIEVQKENRTMSVAHHEESFLDRYWQPLVILFGLLFVLLLVSFNPVTYQTEHNVDHNAPASLNSSSDDTSK